LREARQAEAESINTPEAWQLTGDLNEKLGQTAEAIDAFRHVVKLNAESQAPRSALIRLLLRVKKSSEALEHLRRYTLLVGDDAEGLLWAADFHYQMGRLDDAADLAGRAQRQRFHGNAQRLLGLVAFRRGEFDKAVYHLDRAPRGPEVLEALLRAYLLLGKLNQAEQEVALAKRQGNIDDRLTELLQAISALADRRDALLKQLNPAADEGEAVRRAVEAYLCAERLWNEEKAVEQVQGLLHKAFVKNVTIGQAFALRGQLALERGRLSAALEDAERAVQLSPQDAQGYLVRGRVRLERTDGRALADLAKASELTRRKDGRILHWLAAALFQAGRRAEAMTTQEEAFVLLPGDREVRQQLRAFEQKTPSTP
jgi:tetratricopeptide (TPR) repeat protein